jgi:hypothetical protein
MTTSLSCRLLPILGAIVVTLFTLGCSPNAAQVSGTVTLDGSPLTTGTGTVTFHPASGQGAIAYGQIDAQGRYKLSTGTNAGLTPGSYVATVVASEPIPATSPNEEIQFKSITPEKYGSTELSDLRVEVQRGANDVPLVLKSK